MIKQIPFPNKKYQIIYADPPWKYNDKLEVFSKFANKNKSPRMGACEYYYNIMSINNICNLPIKNISADNCILFLWITMPKLNEVQQVITAWGFKYKTVAFTWIKLNAELVLLATRGKPKRISKSVSQIVMAKRGRHSIKPPVIRDKILELMGDLPRIELFARYKVKGWDAWGNEELQEAYIQDKLI